jgi:hypothetical protein
MLTAEFRCSLSGAIERATACLEDLEKVAEHEGNKKARAITAGTTVD